ncbi:hypothetical protein P3L10_023007 [Capsicum annuum]
MHASHKFNLWLALQQRSTIVDRLMKIGIQVPKTCVICGLADEPFDHLFFDCGITKGIWSRLLRWLGQNRRIRSWNVEVDWMVIGMKQNLIFWEIAATVFSMMIYLIWRARNTLRFQKGTYSSKRIYRDIALHIHTKENHVVRWYKYLKSLNSYP